MSLDFQPNIQDKVQYRPNRYSWAELISVNHIVNSLPHLSLYL